MDPGYKAPGRKTRAELQLVEILSRFSKIETIFNKGRTIVSNSIAADLLEKIDKNEVTTLKQKLTIIAIYC